MDKYYNYDVSLSTAWITVNRACNFRCKWCYAECSNYKIEDDMPLELAKKILDVLVEVGIKHVILIGGEPSMWKSVFKFSDYCKEKSVSCGMVTNACLFGDDHYWERFLESPFSSIGISVKGITEQQFENIVGAKTLYRQTMIGLERLLNYFPNSSVSIVYSNLFDYDDLLLIATRCHELGAKMFQLGGCSATIDGNCANDEFMVDRDSFVETILKIFPVLNELYDGRVVLEPRLPLCVFPKDFLKKLISEGQIQNMCHVQNRSGIVFDNDGYILPCNSMVEVKMGKIGKDFSNGKELLALLNSDDIRSGYVEMLKYPSEECTFCDLNDYCRGGCIVNWTVLDPGICHRIVEE